MIKPYYENEYGVLYKGDCLEIIPLLDVKVDLVLTDPPYKTTSRGTHGNAGGIFKNKLTNQGKIFEYNDILPEQYEPLLYDILKEGSHCYVMTNHTNIIKMLNVFSRNFHFIKNLIWMKDNKIMGQAYMSQFEYIMFLRKSAFKKINKCGTSDILQFANKKTKGSDGKNIHDTEKPVGLLEVLIENSTNMEDLVFEPFGGSGSTAIACMNTNRKFIMIEKDEKYCEISAKRMEEHLNKMKSEFNDI